jgi:hypothetical protein
MGGANTGRSNEEEEVNRPEELPHDAHHPHDTRPWSSQTTFRDHHPDVPPLADEPQRRTTQPPAAQAAQETACRPRPPHRHPGPPPRPKSHTTSPEGCRPSRQPRSTNDTRLPPNPCQQLLHPMKQLPNMVSEAAASTRKSSTWGRCPNIHRRVDNRRNTPVAECGLSKTMPTRRKRRSRRHRPPEIRSLGFLSESRNHRGCRRSSTASISKCRHRQDRCWAFARNISTPPREQAALHFSCRQPPNTTAATSLARRPPARGRCPEISCSHTPTNQQAMAPQAKTTGHALCAMRSTALLFWLFLTSHIEVIDFYFRRKFNHLTKRSMRLLAMSPTTIKHISFPSLKYTSLSSTHVRVMCQKIRLCMWDWLQSNMWFNNLQSWSCKIITVLPRHVVPKKYLHI